MKRYRTNGRIAMKSTNQPFGKRSSLFDYPRRLLPARTALNMYRAENCSSRGVGLPLFPGATPWRREIQIQVLGFQRCAAVVSPVIRRLGRMERKRKNCDNM
jgi:hypothetical protein